VRALVQISRKKIQQGFEKNMPKTLLDKMIGEDYL